MHSMRCTDAEIYDAQKPTKAADLASVPRCTTFNEVFCGGGHLLSRLTRQAPMRRGRTPPLPQTAERAPDTRRAVRRRLRPTTWSGWGSDAVEQAPATTLLYHCGSVCPHTTHDRCGFRLPAAHGKRSASQHLPAPAFEPTDCPTDQRLPRDAAPSGPTGQMSRSLGPAPSSPVASLRHPHRRPTRTMYSTPPPRLAALADPAQPQSRAGRGTPSRTATGPVVGNTPLQVARPCRPPCRAHRPPESG